MDNYDSSFDDEPYSLPPDLQHMAKKVEAELRQSIDHIRDGYLVRHQIPILNFDSDQ
jgi:hypothetical protein